jgi:prepilin-type N-terminal cleavage/methylation domain-containing protein
MKTATPQSRGAPAAFTLVELLVAMSILTMLLLVLLSIVDHTTKLWQSSENRVDSYREARAALNIIAADLRAAYVSQDTRLFQLNKENGLPSTAENDKGSLFFLSAQAGDSQGESPPENSSEPGNKSDLCTVGYFQGFDAATFRGAKSMNLYRFFRGSTDTIERIRTAQPLFTDVETGPGGAEVLARNITQFRIRAYTIDKATGRTAEISASDPATPDYIDIELTAVNNGAAKKIPESKAGWQNEESAVIRQNSRTFFLRVNLPPAHPALPSSVQP